MVDVIAKPLVAQGGVIRADPYPQSSAPIAELPPSMQRTLEAHAANPGMASLPEGGVHDELTSEELGHIQEAAAQGDKESWDLLNALKLPLGVAAGAAALYGATRGGLKLVDVLSKNNSGVMDASRVRDPNNKAPLPPEAQRALEGRNGQKFLPAPQGKITDTTGTRFNNGTSIEQPKLIPDLNRTGRETDAAYAQRDAEQATAMGKAELEKSLATARSMRLKSAVNAAAKAARGIH